MTSLESLWSTELFGQGANAPVLDVSPECNYANLTVDESRAELLNFLIDLKETSRLSAKDVCILCYWVNKSSREPIPEIAGLSMAPTAQSGKYSLKYDMVVNQGKPRDRNWYYIDAPIFQRCSGERAIARIPTSPPHEIISGHWKLHHADLAAKFENARDSLSLPQMYYTHPVVLRSAGELVLLLGVYMDAVDFTRQDSEVGIWLVDLFTGQRWLMVILRVSELCKCGCKGNCTLHPFWIMLHWSFSSLARGVNPDRKHDSTAFHDMSRKSAACKSLNVKGCCGAFKSDWNEWSKLGFRSWTHQAHSCALCGCTADNMCMCDSVRRGHFPFPRKTFADYDESCKACEIIVHLSHKDWRSVRTRLVFTGKGRVLSCNIDELGLRKGDCLMPTGALLDIGEGFDLGNPGKATFWRGDKNSATKFRCYFFDPEIGTEPDRILGPDWCHAFSLGLLHHWNGWTFRNLVSADVWYVRRSTEELQLSGSICSMKADLFQWYGTEKTRGNVWTRVQDIKPGMCGSTGIPLLKLYASESNGFLHFTEWLIEQYGERAFGDRLDKVRACQRALAAVHKLLRKHDLRMPLVDADALCEHINTSVRLMRELGVREVPKVHMMAHLADCAYTKGAPAVWACWLDEALNQDLKKISKASHSRVWAERVLDTCASHLYKLMWGGRGKKRLRNADRL